MARLPVASLLLLCFFQVHPRTVAPINLFRQDVGQRTSFHIVPDRGSGSTGPASDTLVFWLNRKSEDTAFYRFDYSRDTLDPSSERPMAWSQGRLTAGHLLSSRVLDTNGIFLRQKVFPQDYRQTTARNRAGSGYTLQHAVMGFVFDTLLVSCAYVAHVDGGDNCDFITTSGILVYSNLWGIFPNRRLPDTSALSAMGGRPVTASIRSIAPGSKAAPSRSLKACDALGRVRFPK